MEKNSQTTTSIIVSYTEVAVRLSFTFGDMSFTASHNIQSLRAFGFEAVSEQFVEPFVNRIVKAVTGLDYTRYNTDQIAAIPSLRPITRSEQSLCEMICHTLEIYN